MNLIVDIGSSRTKYYFFEADKLLLKKSSKTSLVEKVVEKVKELVVEFDLQRVFLSSVPILRESDLEILRKEDKIEVFCSKDTELPVLFEYDRLKIGADRVALAVGGFALYPNTRLLIIDIGTAITIDVLDEKGVFKGGNISPGINSRFKALALASTNLPSLDKDDIEIESVFERGLIAKDTARAIEKGVFFGILFEMEGYIKRFLLDNVECKDSLIVLTGGDAELFAKNLCDEKIKNVVCCLDLLALGLNKILNEYIKK